MPAAPDQDRIPAIKNNRGDKLMLGLMQDAPLLISSLI
jgi:hypothetical protein